MNCPLICCMHINRKKMTPEQREEYMKQKRKENAKKRAKVSSI